MHFEIFKSGKHISSNGTEIQFSDADIAAAAAAYDPTVHEAPIVIGHPSDDAPAWGWIKNLKPDGNKLLAEFTEVDKDFAELVRAKRYKKVSASFYQPTNPNNPKPGTWYLRHLGFLGAKPPSIKGLKQIQFDEKDECLVFTEIAIDSTNNIFRRLREWLLSNFGKDAADEAVPDYLIEQISSSKEETSFSEPVSTSNHKDSNMTVDEKNELEKARAEATAAKAELKRLQDEQDKSFRETSHKSNVDFAENLTKAGKLKPSDKDSVIQILDFMDYPESKTADFGENNKKPLAQILKEFLNNLPEAMDFSEYATKKTAGKNVNISGTTMDFSEINPEALNHHTRAVAYAEKHNVSYEEAARLTV